MSNAIKYTQEGSVTIRVEDSEGRMKLSVIDTGVGISKDKHTELFNAFTKIRQHRELNTEGVGLGLTVSKSLAIAMGGDIAVTS